MLLAAKCPKADIPANALQTGSYQCRKKVVELLLNKSADVSAQGRIFGNVLMWLQP